MSEWISVGPDNLLADGSMAEIAAGSITIILARVEGQYYAVQANCPHLGGRLGRGKLEDHTLTCPLHASQFDVRDGHVIIWTGRFPEVITKLASTLRKPTALRTYPTRVQDGQVWVNI